MATKLEDIASDIGAALEEGERLQKRMEATTGVIRETGRQEILESLAFIISHLVEAAS